MSQKAQLIISLLLAIGFLLFSYWVTNLRFPLSGEKTVLTKLEAIREYFWPRENVPIDSVLFVNVTYDKVLLPVVDDMGLPVGRTQVTDRHKLLRLLQHLKAHDDYKYVLLDVFFGDDIQTQWDEELFATISSMQRIVVPYHTDEKIADEQLMNKAGLADYFATYSESDFVKYPYFCDKAQSVPVKMYEEVTGKKIKKHGIFYTDGWRMARSSMVLAFDLQANDMYADNGVKVWYNLGMDLLDDSIPELDAVGDSLLYTLPDRTRSKYIVIGSLNGDDTHTTFMGEMPGAVINFNAFISLLNGHHIVSVPLMLVYLVVFFLMSYLTLSRKRLQDLLHGAVVSSNSKFRRVCLRLLVALCSWIGYSSVLSVLCIITYLTMGEAYDIFITSTLFTLFSHSITSYSIIHKRIKIWNKKK